MFGRRRLTAFCMHTSADVFVIRKPGRRQQRGVARHEIASPLITDPRTTSTGLYICNVLTCRYATWLDEELLTSTAYGGLIIRGRGFEPHPPHWDTELIR